MFSKQKLKEISSLQQKKFRFEEGLFIAEGKKTVKSLLNSKIKVVEVYHTNDLSFEEVDEIKSAGLIPEKVSEKDMERMSALNTASDVLAVCAIPHPYFDKEQETDLTFVLDGIRDPGNLGTIMRLAAWFGVKNIICSDDTAEYTNPKCVQASMGSIASVNMYYTSLTDFLSSLEKDKIFAASLDGEIIYEVKFNKGIYLIIGSESHGVSEEVLAFCGNKITIPAVNPSGDTPESLNAAVATAIVCSEINRKLNYV
jgi:TrmH family RNA methyltransferase